MRLRTTLIAGASIALAVTGASHGSAVVVNGGFESGNLSGWTVSGNGVATDEVTFGGAVAGGTYHALLQTSSGINSVALADFLGVALADLNAATNSNDVISNGSAMKQTITGVSAGDTLSFDWNFLSDEWDFDPTGNSTFNDSAFMTLVNMTSGEVTTISILANTFSDWSLSDTAYYGKTGYENFTFTFTEAGDYELGFGVVNVGGPTINSALLIDNVTITVIPLPAPVWMGLAGLGGVVLLRRRRLE